MEETIPRGDVSKKSGEDQLVVFALGGEEFGVDINAVREIVRLPEITPVPRSPRYTSGICNLRGSVLPVMDTRCRFGMEKIDPGEDTRMLVVESQGIASGMIVDGIKEVLRLHNNPVEPPPGVCRGVDEAFLSGVVTLDKGKRLVMAIDLENFFNTKMDGDEKDAESDEYTSNNILYDDVKHNLQIIEEEHLVSFQIGSEEYALDINVVREILRVPEITDVPNVPDYVKGVFTIRNKLIPVVDLRKLFGMQSIAGQYIIDLNAVKDSHKNWARELKISVENNIKFSGELNPLNCAFGRWLKNFHTVSQDIQNCINDVRKPHEDLHELANLLLNSVTDPGKTHGDDLPENLSDDLSDDLSGNLLNNSAEDNIRIINTRLATSLDHIDKLKDSIIQHIHEDQRVLVVADNDLIVGYLVDHVNEVARVPESIINETPVIASTQKNEIKGVAKLDDGKRLILIMDQGAILSRAATNALSDISKKEGSSLNDLQKEEDDMTGEYEKQKTIAEQSMEEEQLVTFLLDKVEYGLRIMDVQEINRLETITEVPKAPSFIDGVTNLRGNIIPVLNLRSLFGMKLRKNDDKSRIIIVDINGNKTGLLVDEVKEVMRLLKNDIDKTPAIVTDKGNQFMDGICKLNGGSRMITLIDISKLLSSDEVNQLDGMNDRGQTKTINESAGKSSASSGKSYATEKKKITLKIAE